MPQSAPSASHGQLFDWRREDTDCCTQASSWAAAWGLHWRNEPPFKLADVAKAAVWTQACSVFAGRVADPSPLESKKNVNLTRTDRQLQGYIQREKLALTPRSSWVGAQTPAHLSEWCDQADALARRVAVGWTLSMAMFAERARQTDELGHLDANRWHSKQQWIMPLHQPALVHFALEWAQVRADNALALLACLSRLHIQDSGANLVSLWSWMQQGPLSALWALALAQPVLQEEDRPMLPGFPPLDLRSPAQPSGSSSDSDQDACEKALAPKAVCDSASSSNSNVNTTSANPWANPLSAWLLETPWWGQQALAHWGRPSPTSALRAFNQRHREQVDLEHYWETVVGKGHGVRLGPVRIKEEERVHRLANKLNQQGLLSLPATTLEGLGNAQAWDTHLWKWATPALAQLTHPTDVLQVNQWVGQAVMGDEEQLKALEALVSEHWPLSLDKKTTWLWHTAAFGILSERSKTQEGSKRHQQAIRLTRLVQLIDKRKGRSVHAMLPTRTARWPVHSLAMEALFAADEEALEILEKAGAPAIRSKAFWATRKERMARLSMWVGVEDRKQREVALEKALSFWQRLSMHRDWQRRQQKRGPSEPSGPQNQVLAEGHAIAPSNLFSESCEPQAKDPKAPSKESTSRHRTHAVTRRI